MTATTTSVVPAPADRVRLTQAAMALGAQRSGADGWFTGGTTDSRNIQPGEIFVALKGDKVDGHDFIAMARERGAAAAVVEHALSDPLPQLIVPDARHALGMLGALWRAQYCCPLIGLTGSNGKTTVKELLAAILAQRGSVLATQGNFNNDIGVPLTLLRLRAAHEFAVIEMGANHPGEIAYLTGLAHPTVAIVNNAGPAHLEGFGSIEGVAHAKGEIFSGLAPHGVAVINGDDQYAPVWRRLNAGRTLLSFGLSADADVRATFHGDALGNHLRIVTPQGEGEAYLQLPGRHNVLNALAATAAALVAGATLQDVKRGLEAAHGAPGRMQSKVGYNGARVIDDTYNANPASVQAAIDVLAQCSGRRIFVLGDLAELGAGAEQLHATIGAATSHAGLDLVFTVGTLSAHTASGCTVEHRHFATQDALIAALRPVLAPNVTVLVKGSRSAHMERVAVALAQGGEK